MSRAGNDGILECWNDGKWGTVPNIPFFHYSVQEWRRMFSRRVWIKGLVAITALALMWVFAGCANKPQLVTETEEPSPRVAVSGDPLEELTVPQFQEEEPAQIAIGAPSKVYSLRVRKGELHDVLLGFAQESGENLVIDPEVAGIVTMNLNRVTLEQALDALLTPLGFTYWREGRLIRISKPRMETRFFAVNYVSSSRQGSKTIVATDGSGTGGAEGSISKTRFKGSEHSDFWAEIQEGLTAIIFGDTSPKAMVSTHQGGVASSLTSPNGKKLVISRLSGLIQVNDYPRKLREVARFLEQMEAHSLRQVLIQARFLEVGLNKEFNTGIRWDKIQEQLLNLDISRSSLSWDLDGGTASTKGVLAIVSDSKSPAGTEFVFAELVKALETQGKVRALASPRLATLNNQKVIVKIGRQDVYFTSEISQTSENVLQSFTPNTIDVGVILDVTPQIAPDGQIIMNIHPSITAEFDRVRAPDGSEFPLLQIGETDTVVRVLDGQTIVIAGLLQEKDQKARNSLSCILFGSTNRQAEKTELVILLNPKVLTGKRLYEMTRKQNRKLDLLEQEDARPIDYLRP
ncbi:MAG: secretin and TonB N-terminal domain-containing protein [Deltaproteobacteria bacterium]|nr:secretin and TonB N-terminal domain-containing protein [Deltaproteobacteria bacterium]